MQPLEQFAVRSYPAMGEVVSLFTSSFANWLFLIAWFRHKGKTIGMELVGGLLIPRHPPLTNRFLRVSSTLWVRNSVSVVIIQSSSLWESGVCADFPMFFNPALM